MSTARTIITGAIILSLVSCNDATETKTSETSADSAQVEYSSADIDKMLLEFNNEVMIPYELFEDSFRLSLLGNDTLVLLSPCNLVLKHQLFTAYVISRPATQQFFQNQIVLNHFPFKNREQMEAVEKTNDLIIERDIRYNDLKWPSPATLYYSICRNSFPTNEDYEKTVSLMEEATNDWNGLTNVQFRYLAAFDRTVRFDNSVAQFRPPVSFIVAFQQYNRAIFETQSTFNASQAIAFNKEFAPALRVIRICPAFFNPGREAKAGILRHEIGHIMGFRHEHASDNRIDNCPKENFGMARHVTDYDQNSIMHYPCGGFNNYAYLFTPYDSIGIRSVYN